MTKKLYYSFKTKLLNNNESSFVYSIEEANELLTKKTKEIIRAIRKALDLLITVLTNDDSKVDYYTAVGKTKNFRCEFSCPTGDNIFNRQIQVVVKEANSKGIVFKFIDEQIREDGKFECLQDINTIKSVILNAYATGQIDNSSIKVNDWFAQQTLNEFQKIFAHYEDWKQLTLEITNKDKDSMAYGCRFNFEFDPKYFTYYVSGINSIDDSYASREEFISLQNIPAQITAAIHESILVLKLTK